MVTSGDFTLTRGNLAN